MILEELEQRYGLYTAELVREALTLEEFRRLEIEELTTYFALRAERTYDEYLLHQKDIWPQESPAKSREDYLNILRRRWQQAEELAHMVREAEKEQADSETAQIVA